MTDAERLDQFMGEVSRFLQQHPSSTRTAMVRALPGDRVVLGEALDQLIDRGHVRVGTRRIWGQDRPAHTLIRPWYSTPIERRSKGRVPALDRPDPAKPWRDLLQELEARAERRRQERIERIAAEAAVRKAERHRVAEERRRAKARHQVAKQVPERRCTPATQPDAQPANAQLTSHALGRRVVLGESEEQQ